MDHLQIGGYQIRWPDGSESQKFLGLEEAISEVLRVYGPMLPWPDPETQEPNISWRLELRLNGVEMATIDRCYL